MLENKEKYPSMEQVITMRFDNNTEIYDFLSLHKNVKLLDQKVQEFLVVETEKDDKAQYENKIVARFISENKLSISKLKRYMQLSDKAKKIISCVKVPDDYENPIKIQIGKTFNDIKITRDLYYEVFYFAIDNGLSFWRHNVEGGEITEICLCKDGFLVME
jgi:hypothetical protein